jgi:hypothetical protein
MTLKFQNEIDNFNFTIECPNNVSPIANEVEVFRFSYAPIEHEKNFLPNVVYDKINGGKFNYNSIGNENVKCDRCGASFYYNGELAKSSWNSMPEKLRENLKYTHIAKGLFSPGDGLVTPADNYTHFGFYEAEKESADYLKKKFKILSPL